MASYIQFAEEFPKKPSTIKEQIWLLKQRGLVIDDERFAEEILNRVSYYRLSGYTLSLRTGDVFHKGTSFRLVHRIYEFDQKLRYLLLGTVEVVEIALRTQVANYMALTYGALSYRNSAYFQDPEHHAEFLKEFNKQIESTKNRELFVKHHIEKYESRFPIWAAIEVFSLGMLSKFFRNMKKEDQKAISRQFYKIPPVYLVSWLHSLVTLRNICAHYGRLYNRTFPIAPRLTKEGKKLGIRNDRLFAYVFVLKYLVTNRGQWSVFVTNLQAVLEEYKEDIDMSLIGFPCNWYELLKRTV